MEVTSAALYAFMVFRGTSLLSAGRHSFLHDSSLFSCAVLFFFRCRHESGDQIEIELLSVAVGGMSRPPKPVPQVKKVAPPAVPDVFRHSGSSFGSAGYSSSEDGCFISGSEGQPPRGKPLATLGNKPSHGHRVCEGNDSEEKYGTFVMPLRVTRGELQP